MFLGAAVLSLIGSLASLMIPLLIGRAIDCIFPFASADYPALTRLLSVAGALILLDSGCMYVCTVLLGRASARMIRDMRTDAFGHICRLPFSFFDSRPHGDIISRFISDIETVSEGIMQGLTQVMSGAVVCVGSALMIFAVDIKIAVIILCISPVYILLARFIAKGSAKYFARQQAALGELAATAEEYLSSRETMRAFSLEGEASARFESQDAELYKCGWRAQFYSALVGPSSRMVTNLTYALLGVLCGFAVLDHRLTIGLAASVLTYSANFSRPINEITGVIAQMQAAFASARRFFGMMDEPPEPDDAHLPGIAPDGSSVRFCDVSFRYDPLKPLIEHLDLYIPAGQVVAIVGPTGAGKTTLVNLLMRYYEPASGRIELGGRPIDSHNRDSIRRQFSMVMQDAWLFSAPVRDNIAFARPDSGEDEVVAAAKRASAHGFIKRLPEGYDTVITDEGDNLSQGQRQLLTIARVMLNEAPMLILDEATSSVDTMTELRIQRAFRELMQGKTCFVIAHRLSTIRDADLILVMDHGAVVEQGTHDVLLQQGGLYARLVRAAAGDDAISLGIDGYVQDITSASEAFVPDFPGLSGL